MFNNSLGCKYRTYNLTIRKFSTLFAQMTNNSIAVALLTKRLNEAEKSIRLLSVEVKKIRRDLSLLNAGNDSADGLGVNKYSTTTKRTNLESLDDSFESKKFKEEFTFENGYAIVYTDGACTNNGRRGAKAGLGAWWGPNHPLNVSKPTQKRHTNNAGEIQACTEACKIAAENGIKKLMIRTDSNFVIKCMTEWIHKWKKNNWKTAAGKDVINKEDLVDLEMQSKLLNEVKYEHVSGHSGVRGNEEADRLAVKGAEMI